MPEENDCPWDLDYQYEEGEENIPEEPYQDIDDIDEEEFVSPLTESQLMDEIDEITDESKNFYDSQWAEDFLIDEAPDYCQEENEIGN